MEENGGKKGASRYFWPMSKETKLEWVRLGGQSLPRLDLPPFPLDWRQNESRNEVMCLSRSKFVALEPEEWVRQHWLHHLSQNLHYPIGLISVEHPLELNGMVRRADIICHDRLGKPLLMVECKRHDVPLSKAVLDQVLRYHLALKTPIVVISNGLKHQAFSFRAEQFTSLDTLPPYSQMQ